MMSNAPTSAPRPITLTFLAAAIAALCLAGQAGATTGAISGKAVNAATGRVVAGASVSLIGSNHTATTDLNGVYRLAEVPAGSLSVAVSKEGFQPLTITGVAVTPGEIALVEVPLEPTEERVITLEAVSVSADTVANLSLIHI